MSNKDFTKTEPFVPGKDERIGHGELPKTAARPRSKEPSDNSKPAAAGGVWKMLVIILLLAVAALSWTIYQQQRQQALLREQFDDLQYRISSTDESLSQSGAALSMKLKEHEKELKEHFSEIDKLWAARNVNKKAIADAENNISALKKQITSAATQAKKAEQSAASASQAALAVRAELEEAANLSDSTLARLEDMERAIKQWQVEMNKRVAGNEEAIRAIDSFRRRTNTEIQQLRQHLRSTGIIPSG